jgi:hypothetical protein
MILLPQAPECWIAGMYHRAQQDFLLSFWLIACENVQGVKISVSGKIGGSIDTYVFWVFNHVKDYLKETRIQSIFVIYN